ncbi:18813_t:CDS:2, partial [Gigaspora rosea]
MSLPYDQYQNQFTSFFNFQKFVDTKTVLYKYGTVISLAFFSKSESKNTNNDKKNVTNSKQCIFICLSLNDLEYINYVISSPACFGGSKKPEKKLNNKEQKEFEIALESEATWHLDKEFLAVYHMQCKRKTSNENAIYNKCKELRSNKWLNEALKA